MPQQHNHHREVMWNSLSLWFSMCLFVTTLHVVTEFSRNYNFSPTRLPSCSAQPSARSECPHPKHNGRLSSRDRLPPRNNWLLGLASVDWKEWLLFLPFLPLDFPQPMGYITVSCVEINTGPIIIITHTKPSVGKSLKPGLEMLKEQRVQYWDKSHLG